MRSQPVLFPFLLSLAVSLAACGMKGDLYLPDPAITPAPASAPVENVPADEDPAAAGPGQAAPSTPIGDTERGTALPGPAPVP